MNKKTEIMTQVLSEDNINKAIRQVMQKNGCCGVDNLQAKELTNFWEKNGSKIIALLRKGAYVPIPSKRCYISKASGEKRPLAIPSVLDRMIQIAFIYILQDMYEAIFHENSFGFRKNRSTILALHKCLEYINTGKIYVVDMDIKSFFDNINHPILISILKKNISDPIALRLLTKYMKMGILSGTNYTYQRRGVIQGSPLSPLLANVLLNELDWYLDAEKISFVRYADDILLFANSESEAAQILSKVQAYLCNNLSLKCNREKTKITIADDLEYLGYSFKKTTTPEHYILSTNNEILENMQQKMHKHIQNQNIDWIHWWDRLGSFHKGWLNYYIHSNLNELADFIQNCEKEEYCVLQNLFLHRQSSPVIYDALVESEGFVSLTQWFYYLSERNNYDGSKLERS